MDAQSVGRFGQRTVAVTEDTGDEALLELVDRVLELDALVHHLFDEFVESLRDHASSWPVRRR